MQFETIEREVYVDASPQTVFEVVSSPEHVKRWWSDDASYEPSPGAAGELVFLRNDGAEHRVRLEVVDVQPARSFSFRWTQAAGEAPVSGNSLLVKFDLVPSGSGTLLKMTESGFAEMGWDPAVLEREHQLHSIGWDQFIPRIPPYATSLEVRS